MCLTKNVPSFQVATEHAVDQWQYSLECFI